MAADSENGSNSDSGLTQVFMLQSHLIGVTADQTIIFYKPEDLSINYQVSFVNIADTDVHALSIFLLTIYF